MDRVQKEEEEEEKEGKIMLVSHIPSSEPCRAEVRDRFWFKHLYITSQRSTDREVRVIWTLLIFPLYNAALFRKYLCPIERVALMRGTVVSYGKEYAWFLCLFKIDLSKPSECESALAVTIW